MHEETVSEGFVVLTVRRLNAGYVIERRAAAGNRSTAHESLSSLLEGIAMALTIRGPKVYEIGPGEHVEAVYERTLVLLGAAPGNGNE